MPHAKRTPKHTKHASKSHGHAGGHKTHSPFFLLWELITLACVVFVAEAIIYTYFFHPGELLHHELERWEFSAEIILIAEVVLLVVVARDKIRFVLKNWPTILAVLPFGGGMRAVQVLKIVWHAFEKTRVAKFLQHPIRTTRRWVHINLGLRV